MRRAPVALWLIATLTVHPALGQEQLVTATQILSFMGRTVGEALPSGLVWRGGLNLTSETDEFGGLSSLGFVGDDGRLVVVSDRGNFVAGQLIYDEVGQPFNLVGVTITPMRNSRGAELPRAFARDAEAMDVVLRDGVPAAVRVGFENLTRVADFDLVDGVPQGAAREISVPQWLTDSRTNETLESLCIAPPTSPIAGSTLLITEAMLDGEGNHRATLLGSRDKGDLTLTALPGVNPTDCAFLPDGDLLVLERGIALFAFAMKLRRIPAADVHAGAVMGGQVLLEVSGGDIDNMEALAVHTAPDGEIRVTLMSDNNFNEWERNLLLEFGLPG